ncbi:MAG: UpxY family transcription antiterminator [Lacibacter sp.]
MTPSETPYWYAVYTRPNMEKKVTEALANKGLVVYCPLQKVQRQWSDRRKILEIPAFKGYVFVYIHDSIRWQVLAANGVLNFVCHCGKPARIQPREIEIIRSFFKDFEHRVLQEEAIQVADMARVNSGLLMGMEGEVVSLHHRYAILTVPSLGLAMKIKVERESLELIKRKAG